MADDPKKGAKIQVQMDDSVAQGTYANLVLINHSENEFLLDFAFMQPGNPLARVSTRIISSPRHTKRLLKALQNNVERYEQRFGEIEMPSKDDDQIVH